MKTTKTGPRKRSRRADDTSEDESEDDEDEEEELTESAESEEEEEEGEAVIGRGGRRGAKVSRVVCCDSATLTVIDQGEERSKGQEEKQVEYEEADVQDDG